MQNESSKVKQVCAHMSLLVMLIKDDPGERNVPQWLSEFLGITIKEALDILEHVEILKNTLNNEEIK